VIDNVLVPKDRVKVIKDEVVRRRLKKELNVSIWFEGNCVILEGEGVDIYLAKTIVKAMGRGFSPTNASRLFDESQMFESIELNQYSDGKVKIIKARLIGTGGKAWRMIEKLSGCSLSVYGKTVSMIGTYEQLNIAREAVQMIIRGSRHSKVYGFLFQSQPE
jgi:ribosomal RNA assembly protein